MKLMDLPFAKDVMTAEGQAVDKAAPKRWWAEAAAKTADAFRNGGGGAMSRFIICDAP